MMSSMHKKAMTLVLARRFRRRRRRDPGAGHNGRNDVPGREQRSARHAAARPPMMAAPAPVMPSSEVSSALARWSSLRQSDNLPFSSYARS
jgi:hypothetical protein